MIKTYKVLSALLSYPTADLQAEAWNMHLALDTERLLLPRHRAAIAELIDEIAASDLLDVQACYVDLFDRTRALSLHMFEHVHGESRDRGQAMVDLLKLYEEGGYTPTPRELPDFLPLFLEYASTLAPKAAIELIGQPANVIAALRERLAKRRSPYEAVMAALLALSRAKLDDAALATLRAEPDPEPDDLEALDAAWVEQEVTFGPGTQAASSCPVDRMADRLRAAVNPAAGGAS